MKQVSLQKPRTLIFSCLWEAASHSMLQPAAFQLHQSGPPLLRASSVPSSHAGMTRHRASGCEARGGRGAWGREPLLSKPPRGKRPSQHRSGRLTDSAVRRRPGWGLEHTPSLLGGPAGLRRRGAQGSPPRLSWPSGGNRDEPRRVLSAFWEPSALWKGAASCRRGCGHTGFQLPGVAAAGTST